MDETCVTGRTMHTFAELHFTILKSKGHCIQDMSVKFPTQKDVFSYEIKQSQQFHCCVFLATIFIEIMGSGCRVAADPGRRTQKTHKRASVFISDQVIR